MVASSWPFPNNEFADLFGFALRVFETVVFVASVTSAYLHFQDGGGRRTPVTQFHERHALFTFLYCIPRMVLMGVTNSPTPKFSHAEKLPGDCAVVWRFYYCYNYAFLLSAFTFFNCGLLFVI